jgi:TolB-like protein/class 3 adenylate cyclase
MASEQRRLAAIVAADVAGYSRLMGSDESGTLAALKAVRREVIDPRIEVFRGRLVKTTGDGLLLEFASVVEAVRCVADIQSAMAGHNEAVPDDRRIVLRMGVNLGDIIIEDGDIFGDGVNVAARLQAIAAPGGMCIADRVHEEVRDRLNLAFESGGAESLKNISRPVHVWRWAPHMAARAPPSIPITEVARSLGQKPAMAVLPFDNLSGGTDQDYFADGVTEDIITALSRFHELLISPRSSTFPLKGKGLAIREIARQLGVHYVLSGSMRRAQNRIRVTAELTHCDSGLQVWSDRYDRDLADIFDLQDEISRTVAAVVHPAVRGDEVERARRKRPENLSAYDLYLRALPHMWAGTRDEIPLAIELLRQSLQRDEGNVPTLAALAWCLAMAAPLGAVPPGEALPEALRLARRAVEHDKTDAFAQSVYAQALSAIADEYEQGCLHAGEAVRLNPSSAFAWGSAGFASFMAGDFERGVESLNVAVGLSPSDSLLYLWTTVLAASFFAVGRYDEGVAAARKAVQTNPGYGTAHRLLAANLAAAGRLDEACEVTRKRDGVQRTSIGEIRALRLFRQADILERYLSAQRACGVSD